MTPPGAPGGPSDRDAVPAPSADDGPRLALDHAWRYFELHANQRIAVFNFFVVASGLVFAGVAATLRADDWRVALGVPGGLLVALMAFACWKLDQRGAALVKAAERALAEAEASLLPAWGRLVADERRRGPDKGHWTYGSTFRALFATVALVGLAAAAVSATRTAVRWDGRAVDDRGALPQSPGRGPSKR